MIPEPGFNPISEELQELAASLERNGVTPDQVATWVGQVSELPESDAPLRKIKENIATEPGRFERLVLHWAGSRHAPLLDRQPVPEQVQKFWLQEWRWMTQTAPAAAITLGTPGFEAAAKIATFRRFPAGPMDWETSGIPRSWLLHTQRKTDALRLSSFIASPLGGFQPLLFLHMGRKPRNRTLILEAEVMKMYHRACQAIALQPQMRGLMAYGWFHDPKAVEHNPHLEWLNRPYRDAGGLLVNLGPAGEGSGVAEGNAARRQSLADGTLSYRIGLALWPRQAMLDWARQHPQWAD